MSITTLETSRASAPGADLTGDAPLPAPGDTPRWVRAVQLLGACSWVALLLWRLDRVPGMSMDEAWSILSARGVLEPANPLSGMSAYTGPFPVLALRAFGALGGQAALRGVSFAAHAALLLALAALLRGLYRDRALACWALPMIATTPAWLISARIGIDVTMFTAPLAVLGFYCASRGSRGGSLLGGALWGVAVYNHLLGLWAVIAIASAWLLVYGRRWRAVAWAPLLSGFALGLVPRLLAMALYDNTQIAGTAASLSLPAALADLRWTPRIFWETLDGRTVYYRYVGRLAREVLPYWAIGLSFLVPWIRPWRLVPRAAAFTLLAVLAFCVLTTLGAPYLESRYLVLAVIGLPLALAILGAAAIERDARWRYLVWASAGAISAGNLFYAFSDFYLPWQRHELGIISYPLGDRSPPVGSWHFLPKEGLIEQLEHLDPRPEQIVTHNSLYLPLSALMVGTSLRLTTPEKADRKLRSVFVDYRPGRRRPRHCVRARNGNLCFVQPSVVDQQYVIYHRTG